MVVKNQKLEKQFDAEASSSSHSGSDSGKRIFSGVSIFVDGFTVPSSQVWFIKSFKLFQTMHIQFIFDLMMLIVSCSCCKIRGKQNKYKIQTCFPSARFHGFANCENHLSLTILFLLGTCKGVYVR